MFDNKLTTEVEFNYDTSVFNQKVLASVSQVLNYIDQLTQRGGQDPLILNVENEYYEKIIESLRDGISELSDEDKKRIKGKLDEMSGGIYDLDSINYKSPDSVLILGKIYSAQKSYQKRYVATFGLVNSEANAILKEYDKIAEDEYKKFPYVPDNKKEIFEENRSDINCIDVLRFAGDFNLVYKPISLFYTGTKSRELHILPKVVLFTNIYFKRYELVSEELGRRFIYDYYENEKLPREDINKILVYWLRGHDLGHFFGRDVLGTNLKDKLSKSKEDNRRVYYLLNELKSDIISLYIFKNRLKDLLGDIDLRNVYLVFISELLRYMRRGHLLHYADGGSAYLAYKYFIKSGALKISYNNMHEVNHEQLSIDIDNLCEELIDLFEEGSAVRAVAFVKSLIKFENILTKDLSEDLEFLIDSSIPYNIDIKNNPNI